MRFASHVNDRFALAMGAVWKKYLIVLRFEHLGRDKDFLRRSKYLKQKIFGGPLSILDVPSRLLYAATIRPSRVEIVAVRRYGNFFYTI